MGTPSHPNRTVRVKDLDRFRQKLAEAGDTAYHKPQGGIPKSDLDSSVQQSLDKADGFVHAQFVDTTLVFSHGGVFSGTTLVIG